jgi:hypothetical protein
VHALVLAAALAGTPTTHTADVAAAASAVRQQATTGTLLFSRGDCLAVKVYTASAYTHVAAVVVEEGEPIVYDAANGPGVRRQRLDEYLEVVRPDAIHVVRPQRPFTPRRTKSFRDRLERELGRPYDVMHHVTGERARGLHCAEYVTDALVECRLLEVKCPPRVSPASLREGVLAAELYDHVMTLEIDRTPEPRETGTTWCHQMWIDTKTCLRDFGRSTSRMVLCR